MFGDNTIHVYGAKTTQTVFDVSSSICCCKMLIRITGRSKHFDIAMHHVYAVILLFAFVFFFFQNCFHVLLQMYKIEERSSWVEWGCYSMTPHKDRCRMCVWVCTHASSLHKASCTFGFIIVCLLIWIFIMHLNERDMCNILYLLWLKSSAKRLLLAYLLHVCFFLLKESLSVCKVTFELRLGTFRLSLFRLSEMGGGGMKNRVWPFHFLSVAGLHVCSVRDHQACWFRCHGYRASKHQVSVWGARRCTKGQDQ